MHFSENQNLTPMTPDWLLTPKKIEGLKLMHMYELHKYTMKKEELILSENQNLNTMTPNDPRLTFDPIT